MGWDLVRTHTRRSLVRHHAGAVGPTQGAGSWLSAASLAEAGLRVLEKKSAVVQRLFQWVGIWCVHTHYVALSDTMQERWDLRRARGRGYWQVRVPGASAGDISYGIEPSTRPTIRTEPTSSSLACSLTAIILSHLIAPLWHSATRTEIRTQASWVDLHCRPTWPWQACFFDHHENEQLLLYRHSNA